MKKREQIAPEDLAGALQDRIGPTSGRLLGASPIRRVKVGEAWAVQRKEDGAWLTRRASLVPHVERSERALLSRVQVERFSACNDGVRIVRVTFYEVRRG